MPTRTGGLRRPRRSPTTPGRRRPVHGPGAAPRRARRLAGVQAWPACPARTDEADCSSNARDVTAERLAAQREATLAGFAAALAATGEISEMLTTATREIAAAIDASQVTTALWSSDGKPRHHQMAPARFRPGRLRLGDWALDVVRHQLAASVVVLPGDEDTSLLTAPLDGTGSSAIAAEFPAGRPVGAEVRELFSVLTSHLAQVLAKARDYEQARAVALTLQHAILGPTELPHGFAARYTPAVPRSKSAATGTT